MHLGSVLLHRETRPLQAIVLILQFLKVYKYYHCNHSTLGISFNIMLEPEVHDGFLHFSLPPDIQEYLNAVDGLSLDKDGTVVSGQLEKVEPRDAKSNVKLYLLSWPDEKKIAARRIIMELVRS